MVISDAGMGLAGPLIPPAFYADTMPSLAGRPLLEALNLFTLIFLSCLALEWAWRTGWSLIEHSSKIKDPSTSLRWTILLVLAAILLRLAPDTALAMSWAEMSPGQRYGFTLWDKRLDSASIVPFAIAWALAYLGGPMVVHQLRREPFPLHLWPTWRQVARPAKIALACMALAVVLTFLR